MPLVTSAADSDTEPASETETALEALALLCVRVVVHKVHLNDRLDVVDPLFAFDHEAFRGLDVPAQRVGANASVEIDLVVIARAGHVLGLHAEAAVMQEAEIGTYVRQFPGFFGIVLLRGVGEADFFSTRSNLRVVGKILKKSWGISP